jgi:predicted kinase
LVGLQGSGKTTWFLEKCSQTHVYVSRDIQKTAAAEGVLIANCLKTGRSFSIDDANATRPARAPYIGDAKIEGLRVGGYFFDVPARTAIGRNNHSEGQKADSCARDSAHGEAHGKTVSRGGLRRGSRDQFGL